MAVNYHPAPFEASSLLHNKFSNSISLIKVPQFLADRWKTVKDRSVIATSYKNSKTGKTYIEAESGTGSAVTTLVSQPPQECCVCVIQKKQQNEAQADILCQLEKSKTFIPVFDNTYLSMLKERHSSIKRAGIRSTIEAKRENYELEGSQTLFRYYIPKHDNQGEMSQEEIVRQSRNAASSRTKAKGKKVITIDDDSMKIRLFQLFEKAGDEGLQLKQIVLKTDQPLHYVKSVVDEIAVQRKRQSDRKTMYFLKDYKPIDASDEDPPTKKPKRN